MCPEVTYACCHHQGCSSIWAKLWGYTQEVMWSHCQWHKRHKSPLPHLSLFLTHPPLLYDFKSRNLRDYLNRVVQVKLYNICLYKYSKYLRKVTDSQERVHVVLRPKGSELKLPPQPSLRGPVSVILFPSDLYNVFLCNHLWYLTFLLQMLLWGSF